MWEKVELGIVLAAAHHTLPTKKEIQEQTV